MKSNKSKNIGALILTSLLIGNLALLGELYRRSNNLINQHSQLIKPEIKKGLEIVKQGELSYNKGKLVTYDLRPCSAVVFDYGDSGIMAHAFPIFWEDNPDVFFQRKVLAANVVSNLIEESKSRGLNPREAKAHVNAGSKKALDLIVKDLSNSQIQLVEANIGFGERSNIVTDKVRIAYFDPASSNDVIMIYRNSEFPKD